MLGRAHSKATCVEVVWELTHAKKGAEPHTAPFLI